MKNLYMGITHFCPMCLLPIWKKFLCSRQIHCFDQVFSSEEDGRENSLVCDACGLTIYISEIEK